MTDSFVAGAAPVGTAAGQRLGKRERLVAAARQLVYQQGIERTTIADIAHAADVPVGNVYYYFKTKDEIIAAVIDAHVHEVESVIASITQRYRTPKARLKALVDFLAGQAGLVARYGCPNGTLCAEQDKRGAAADPSAAQLMRIPIDWAAEQFRAMGRPDADDLAVDLIAAYQGGAQLTQALGDPELLARQGRRITRWIDSLDLQPG
jgi:AcrR family transcriptional regulator